MKYCKLTLTFLVLALASCKKSSSGSTDNPNSVVGKWNIVTYIEKVTVSNGQVLTDTTQASHGDNLNFLANGTEYSNAWYDLTINWYSNDNYASLYVSSGNQDFSSDTVSYRVSGSQLFFSQGGYTDTIAIKTLTDHQMILYAKVLDTLDTNITDVEESWRVLSK